MSAFGSPATFLCRQWASRRSELGRPVRGEDGQTRYTRYKLGKDERFIMFDPPQSRYGLETDLLRSRLAPPASRSHLP